MMDLLSEYRSKLRTADEAVKIVKDGDCRQDRQKR